jgi:hypothetical protein
VSAMAYEDLAALGAVVEACVMLALIYVWIHTGGLVVNWIDQNVAGISVLGVHPLSFLHGPLQAFNNDAQDSYYFWLNAAQASWNQWVKQTATLISDVTYSANYWMQQTESALHYLVRWKIPEFVGAVTDPLAFAIRELEKAGRAVTHEVTHVVKPYINDITKDITRTVTRVEKVTTTVYKTTTKSVAIDLPKVWHGIDTAERDASKAWERANEAVKKLSIPAVLGLVAASVFEGLKLGWLRCSNVNRVGRFLCGFDRALLDALLLGLAAWLGTIGIEAFAKDVQAVTRDFDDVVRKFWQADKAGSGSGHTFGTYSTLT